jgi:hypothetical protein
MTTAFPGCDLNGFVGEKMFMAAHAGSDSSDSHYDLRTAIAPLTFPFMALLKQNPSLCRWKRLCPFLHYTTWAF